MTESIDGESSTRPPRPPRPTRSVPAPPPSDPTILPNVVPSSTELSPLRAHYLKKSLIQLQFSYELDAITTHSPTNVSTLSFLGSPFSPPHRDAKPSLDLPLLRYIFRQFVLTFPFMAAAPKNFYSDKLQPFSASVLARNLSPTSVLDDDDVGDGKSEQATRMKLMEKLERNLSLFVGAATKLTEQEEVVRLNQSDLDRLEAIAEKRRARGAKTKDVFEVNIVGVKTVLEKGRMRTRAHDVRFLISFCLLFRHPITISFRNLLCAPVAPIFPMFSLPGVTAISEHWPMRYTQVVTSYMSVS